MQYHMCICLCVQFVNEAQRSEWLAQLQQKVAVNKRSMEASIASEAYVEYNTQPSMSCRLMWRKLLTCCQVFQWTTIECYRTFVQRSPRKVSLSTKEPIQWTCMTRAVSIASKQASNCNSNSNSNDSQRVCFVVCARVVVVWYWHRIFLDTD
jgi:hypothetical protein